VHNKQTDTTFEFRAKSSQEMASWVSALTASCDLPEPPGLKLAQIVAEVSSVLEGVSPSTAEAKLTNALDEKFAAGEFATKHVTSIKQARKLYAFFSAQRDFIRNLTNAAEALRALTPDMRQEALQAHVDKIPWPSLSYFPLSYSDEPCCRLLRFTPNESIVFNTKARCPLMMICEVHREDYSVRTITRSRTFFDLADDMKSQLVGQGEPPSGPPPPTLVEKRKETWQSKADRLRASSPLSKNPGWEVRSFIVKSNDDLRQEVFIMQMIRYFNSIWPSDFTWLKHYHILATGPDTGLIETITGSSDLDNLKKREGYGSLRNLFVTRHGPPSSEGFLVAQQNFLKSLAGYSVLMWLLELRDRHNGNLMITEDGYYFHIDFGFCLGHSTGKQIGGLVECSPFKLTEEYIDLLDGRASPIYEQFCQACVAAIKASHAHAAVICTMVEIVGTRSQFPCFKQTHIDKVMPALRKRLFMDTPAENVEAEFRNVINKTAGHWGSRRYDWFQNKQQGIAI